MRMNTEKKPTKLGKGEVTKLKLKKQTLKDLTVAGSGIKGGAGTASGPTVNCTGG
jgi:hypothetical protein